LSWWEALATFERTGSWPKLGRSGKLPLPIAKAKAAIEAKLAKANKERSRNFFKPSAPKDPAEPAGNTQGDPSDQHKAAQKPATQTVDSGPVLSPTPSQEAGKQPKPLISTSSQTECSSWKRDRAIPGLTEDGSIEPPKTLAQV
ncbi:hypothetical protein FOZ63_022335, partial [Perkinsus olseni]